MGGIKFFSSSNFIYLLKGLKEKEKENALNEVRILASITHVNMIAYKDAFFDEKSESLCIVMEFAEKGDLQGKNLLLYINLYLGIIDKCSKSNKHIEEQEVWKIIVDVLKGL